MKLQHRTLAAGCSQQCCSTGSRIFAPSCWLCGAAAICHSTSLHTCSCLATCKSHQQQQSYSGKGQLNMCSKSFTETHDNPLPQLGHNSLVNDRPRHEQAIMMDRSVSTSRRTSRTKITAVTHATVTHEQLHAAAETNMGHMRKHNSKDGSRQAGFCRRSTLFHCMPKTRQKSEHQPSSKQALTCSSRRTELTKH